MITLLVAMWLPVQTPGLTNPKVTPSNIHQTICVKGWTKTIRPPVTYTTALKRKQLGPGKSLKLYEEDHLIPLELGGHPRDPRNLWPQVWNGACGAHVKDELENKLNHLVCAGKLNLRVAQHAIATDWVAAYKRYVNPKGCQ